MNNLWMRMLDTYGEKFAKDFGDSPNETWMAVLSEYTDKQIWDGFDAARREYKTWPPRLPEFEDLCAGLTAEFKKSLRKYPSDFDIAAQNMTQKQIDAYADSVAERELVKVRRELISNKQYVNLLMNSQRRVLK